VACFWPFSLSGKRLRNERATVCLCCLPQSSGGLHLIFEWPNNCALMSEEKENGERDCGIESKFLREICANLALWISLNHCRRQSLPPLALDSLFLV